MIQWLFHANHMLIIAAVAEITAANRGHLRGIFRAPSDTHLFRDSLILSAAVSFFLKVMLHFV